jgi:excisionase family DNA binding protein
VDYQLADVKWKLTTMIENIENIADYIQVGEASRIAGVSHVTIHEWAIAGKLPFIQLASGQRMRLFKRADVERVVAERRNTGKHATPAA